jgi:hypothetical protein
MKGMHAIAFIAAVVVAAVAAGTYLGKWINKAIDEKVAIITAVVLDSTDEVAPDILAKALSALPTSEVVELAVTSGLVGAKSYEYKEWAGKYLDGVDTTAQTAMFVSIHLASDNVMPEAICANSAWFYRENKVTFSDGRARDEALRAIRAALQKNRIRVLNLVLQATTPKEVE